MAPILGIDPEDFGPEFRPVLEAAGPAILALPVTEWDGHVVYVIEEDDHVRAFCMSRDAALRWEESLDELPDGTRRIRSEIEEFEPGPGKVLLVVISAQNNAQVAPFFVRNVLMSDGSDAEN
jgi:hypothetical protein